MHQTSVNRLQLDSAAPHHTAPTAWHPWSTSFRLATLCLLHTTTSCSCLSWHYSCVYTGNWLSHPSPPSPSPSGQGLSCLTWPQPPPLIGPVCRAIGTVTSVKSAHIQGLHFHSSCKPLQLLDCDSGSCSAPVLKHRVFITMNWLKNRVLVTMAGTGW